jgi:hypothetical protein
MTWLVQFKFLNSSFQTTSENPACHGGCWCDLGIGWDCEAGRFTTLSGLSLERLDTRGCFNPGLWCGIPLGFMMGSHWNGLTPGVVSTPGFGAESLWDS